MTANPPHPPGPGDRGPVAQPDGARRPRREDNALSGGTHGILAVTLATLGLGLAAVAVAALVAWLV